jgi:uncharacterized protein (DUF433 family)
MSYEEKIEPSHIEFLYGNILVKGTKVSVGTIVREVAQGNSINDIITKRPEVSSADIYACLEYAAELIDAIEYSKAKTAINVNIAKRKALADKIRSFKGKPAPGWTE